MREDCKVKLLNAKGIHTQQSYYRDIINSIDTQ